MDERLVAVRAELEAGSVSPRSLIVLFEVASESDEKGDLAVLKETRELARAIAAMASGAVGVEAERLAELCEQSLVGHRSVWWDE